MGSCALIASALSLALGTLCGLPAPPELRLFAAALFAAYCIYVALARKANAVHIAAILAFVFGCANASLRVATQASIVPTHTFRFTATILSGRESETGFGKTYVVRLADGRHILLACKQLAQPGDEVTVLGRIEPFDEARNPGETSQRDIERERGLIAMATGSIVARSPSHAGSPDVLLARAHQWALDRFEDAIGEPGATILAGELWGARSSLPADLHDAFQATGTVHILVTAGLHVGLIAALVLLVLTRLSVPRAISCLCAGVVIWLFVISSGAALPAIRAATMASAILAARACGMASRSWNSLAIAAIVVCVADPLAVDGASFALSFSCVGAIFACAPALESLLERFESIPARLREALVLTFATQLGTWPISAAVFLQLTTYALPANLLVVPFVPVTMVLGMAQLALSSLPAFAQAVANCNGWILAWIVMVVKVMAAAPLSTVALVPAAPATIVLYESALVASAMLVRRGGVVLGISILAFASSLVLFTGRSNARTLTITAVDVGQADSLLIRTPAGHAFLVDAGGRLELGSTAAGSIAERAGERIVVPLLLRSGVRELDAAILTHPHGDHAGGMAATMRKLHVDAFADSGQQYSGRAYADAIVTAHNRHIPIIHPRLGDTWSTDDGVTLTFLGPSLPFIKDSGDDVNENSIAFVLRYRNFRMLFTGDAGSEAEQRFLRSGIDLHADVLKVGHHGSAYATTAQFLRAVRPRYAVISVGRHNTFGHPARSTLARLEDVGATVYRTDENGAVTITTDGSRLRVEPMISPIRILSAVCCR